MLKKIYSYVLSVILFPMNIIRLIQKLDRLFELEVATGKINADLNILLEKFGPTAEHYNRFVDSLTKMSSLYQGFKTDSDYIRIQLDDIAHRMNHGPEKPVDVKKINVIEIVRPTDQQTSGGTRG